MRRIEQLQIVYCEGWDGEDQAVVGPLDPGEARRRDAAGEQYAVLAVHEDSPVAVAEISWRHRSVTVWRFDRERRRTGKHHLRCLADERLLLIEAADWHYPDPDRPEFDPTVARQRRRYSADGRLEELEEPGENRGGSRYRHGRVAVESLRHPVPPFGDWSALVALAVEAVSPTATCVETDTLPAGLTVSARTEPPWRPPSPLRPGPVERLFQAGTRLPITNQTAATVEVRDVGQLRMPTGQLVACDPAFLQWPEDSPPFTVSVPPGSYPVTLSVARWVDQPAHVRVAAARLAVSEEPVHSWHLALRPGEEPLTLGDGEFFGFGVDAGMACFVDAAATPAFRALLEQDEDWQLFNGMDDDVTVSFDLPDAGANLIAFASGWGDGAYPTWIGRDASGEVVCFVADMLLAQSDA